MAELLCYVFIAVWFIYWGWMLIHKPKVVVDIHRDWNAKMGKVGSVAGKAAVTLIKAGMKVNK